jgi:hypothetical protein
MLVAPPGRFPTVPRAQRLDSYRACHYTVRRIARVTPAIGKMTPAIDKM